MKLFKNGNWGLKLLALILAIVLYYTLEDGLQKKTDAKTPNNHDRSIFQAH